MADPQPTSSISHNMSGTESLESQTRHKVSTSSSLRRDIDRNFADIPVYLCSLVSGLCDSTTFNASSVFVSMQAGNTVFLALGAAHLPADAPALWLRALCSIGAFVLGVLAFSQTRRVGPTAKGTLLASFLAQALLVLAVAPLGQGGAAPGFWPVRVAAAAEAMARRGKASPEPCAFVVIALLAFQLGGQIVASRQLGFNEVPANIRTSVYCDLFSDPHILAPWRENPKRDRRASGSGWGGAMRGGAPRCG
ncbi:hypothetical protein DL765_005207 [Monosporascus sp. GIB2]|nr:hypothetical protein DL765_005207 [Monosporascus sp. GIB2]